MGTRVLLERLIVHRPHPWGLLITFIELIKNPKYNFWKHEFVHCAPEIDKLFESVARSCMQGQEAVNPTADAAGEAVASAESTVVNAGNGSPTANALGGENTNVVTS